MNSMSIPVFRQQRAADRTRLWLKEDSGTWGPHQETLVTSVSQKNGMPSMLGVGGRQEIRWGALSREAGHFDLGSALPLICSVCGSRTRASLGFGSSVNQMRPNNWTRN